MGRGQSQQSQGNLLYAPQAHRLNRERSDWQSMDKHLQMLLGRWGERPLPTSELLMVESLVRSADRRGLEPQHLQKKIAWSRLQLQIQPLYTRWPSPRQRQVRDLVMAVTGVLDPGSAELLTAENLPENIDKTIETIDKNQRQDPEPAAINAANAALESLYCARCSLVEPIDQAQAFEHSCQASVWAWPSDATMTDGCILSELQAIHTWMI